MKGMIHHKIIAISTSFADSKLNLEIELLSIPKLHLYTVAHCVQVKESNLQREEDTGVDKPAAEGNEHTSTPHDSDVAKIQASRSNG